MGKKKTSSLPFKPEQGAIVRTPFGNIGSNFLQHDPLEAKRIQQLAEAIHKGKKKLKK